ncbi:MAG: 16S rRNA (adenine(1518)-N(6)/adenine(1519)-N(6))-dimethyltransferase RsmA [Candidatus Omnitrophota bacterium]
MLTKTQLKEIFARYGFAPLKKLGENYLIDGNIRGKILSAAAVSKDDLVLEIGPGLGALTIDLAETGARVIAVEKDKLACKVLKELAGHSFPNLEIINGDILKFTPDAAGRGRRMKVVGNLPYYITSPVIEYILQNRRVIESAVIMVQKEVALRLLAGPGSDDYGSLSCFVQYYAHPEYVYTVKRTCFYPAPEVDSAIVKLGLFDRAQVQVKDESLFFKVVRGAFNQRRKTILNSLSRAAVLDLPKAEVEALLQTAGIDPASRPERLNIFDFARISNAVAIRKIDKAGIV